MQEIKGKSGTVRFDVEAIDEETVAALETIISGTLKVLVNKDSQNIKRMLVAKSNEPRTSSSSKYERENLEKPMLFPLGGKWAYSVAITRDSSGGRSVQICKGKILGGFHRDKDIGKMVLEPEDPMNPISKINKINVKGIDEWTVIQKPVIDRLDALEN